MQTPLKWSLGAVPLCGTGCGVMVAVKDNRVVATADAEAEVNRGVNCIKYHLLEDHVRRGSPDDAAPRMRTAATPRMRVERVSWDQAFDVMAEQFKRAEGQGPTAVGIPGSGHRTVGEGWAAG
jgi:nitrate reductase NapA